MKEIRGVVSVSAPRHRDNGEKLSDHAIATIWSWLVTRIDVSVGYDRNYNALSLGEVLALSGSLTGKDNVTDGTQGRNRGTLHPSSKLGGPSTGPTFSAVRVYVSEDTMWEAITGHSVNYKRVPRSEWLLLLGIASTKSDGILQGDLGRLVAQDKRSVPKRTDSLVKKGYIVKRTTLVRGTKTSKLWLKSFAPPLPKETDDQVAEQEEEINLTHQILAANLDPVPWHTRWTGESMDFHALATTIMATTKEWGVLRLRDLKAKLGVLGLRWQMKIVSKICRFLNSCGAIQYVAAKLDNKVFKDCVRYNKDLSSRDWSTFLATGKRGTKPMKTALLGIADRADLDGHPDVPQINGSRLGETPPWSIDDPLPQKIVKSVRLFEVVGLTNPEIYALTLGPTFNRYISSMTTSMATSNVQPSNLQYLQLQSEHIRVGKVASYRYYISQALLARNADPINSAGRDHPASTACMHWFGLASPKPKFIAADVAISHVCGLVKPKSSTSGEPKKRGRPKRSERSEPKDFITKRNDQSIIESDDSMSPRNTSLIVTFHVPSKELQEAIGLGSRTFVREKESPLLVPHDQILEEKAPNKVLNDDLVHNGIDKSSPIKARPGRGRKRGQARGRGRGRPPNTASTESLRSRPWTCDMCGGSWRNDIGLKYHLERSQTSCNPQYTGAKKEASRREKEQPIISSEACESPDGDSIHALERVASSDRGNRKLAEGNVDESPVVHHTRRRKATAEDPTAGQVQLAVSSSPQAPPSPSMTAKSWKRSAAALDQPIRFSVPKNRQGLLLQPEARHPRQVLRVPITDNSNRRTSKLAGTIEPRATKASPKITGSCPKSPKAATFPQTQPCLAIVHGGSDLTRPPEGLPGDARPSSEGGGRPKAQSKSKGKRSKINNDQPDIRHIIKKMISDQHGVLLGGKLLWDHVITTWNARHPEILAPNRDACQAAVTSLIKDGHIMEHWHVFRDSTGAFAKCQLLTLPGVDAFSPESLRLLDTIKNAQATQRSDAQPTLARDTRSPEIKGGGRGRRLLAKEVAVLHAPVYVAQVAAKKEQVSDARERVKRQRFSDTRQNMEDFSFHITDTQQNIRRPSMTGESSFYPEFQDYPYTLPKAASTMTVEFLQPNTFLGQDAPRVSSPVSIRAVKRLLASTKAATEEPDPTANPRNREPFCRSTTISGQNGAWEYLDTQYFERVGGSFTVSGWMPDTQWFEWTAFVQAIEKRHASLNSTKGLVLRDNFTNHQNFINKLRACFELEISWEIVFKQSCSNSAGPHNLWINLLGEPSPSVSACYRDLSWPKDEQLTQTSDSLGAIATDVAWLSSSDEEFELAEVPKSDIIQFPNNRRPENTVFKAKRVALTTRALTPLPGLQLSHAGMDEDEPEGYPFNRVDDLIAAFVAVRTLMGGSDKAIDWGLLMIIFPTAKLRDLRKFWVKARKQQGSYIANFTRAFQGRCITALERNEIPMMNFDQPEDYDWPGLIRWALQLPRQEGFEIPSSKKVLSAHFDLKTTKAAGEDLRERFFHTQASIFSRFEAVTAVPGVFANDGDTKTSIDASQSKEVDIARSWVKSLCSMGDGKYTAREIRDKFFTLSPGNRQRTSALFKEAIELLTRQKIICKSKRPPLGGRPYRLNEGYVAALSKMAQSSKFDDAAAFKIKMDASFRQHERMRISYTLSDGAMMALTNLNASGRIKLVATNLPNIPFGFEPGNYESRKYPKSYYHFELEAMPAEYYLYNDQIDVLQVAHRRGPPCGNPKAELPQWVDFFGAPNNRRWSEILGAFCFNLATRGSMDIDGIRAALNPILDEFEAQLVVQWGQETGVLTDFADGVGIAVGEWWWLVVPWLRRE